MSGGADTMGIQVRKALLHAHQGYTGVAAGSLSTRSGGGGEVSSDRENDGEKQVRGQGQRVIIPLSMTNRNGRGDTVRGL